MRPLALALALAPTSLPFFRAIEFDDAAAPPKKNPLKVPGPQLIKPQPEGHDVTFGFSFSIIKNHAHNGSCNSWIELPKGAERRVALLASLRGRATHTHTHTHFLGSMTCFDIGKAIPKAHPRRTPIQPLEHGIITRPRRTQNCAKFGEPRVASRVADSIRKLFSPPNEHTHTRTRYGSK